MRQLTAQGVDPFGLAVDELRKIGVTVLAKLRVNDPDHVAGWTKLASQFWHDHPQWRIGNIEVRGGGKTTFNNLPCVHSFELRGIRERRAGLLDYAVPEVRQHRLAIVREFMQRYYVQGLTLNFIRAPIASASRRRMLRN